MDIKSFFISIDQDKLFELTRKGTLGHGGDETRELEWLMRTVIFHRPTKNFIMKGKRSLFSLIPDHKSLINQKEKKGLPIGNHSSQFFANVYLNELDQFVKRELRCRHYIRYVDDFILMSNDRRDIEKWKEKISVFLSHKLDLSISERKTMIQPIKRGIDFLGYFLKPDSIYPRRRVFKRYKDKLFRIAIGECQTNLKYIQSMSNSYNGHFEFRGKFPARACRRVLTFAGRAKLPASISAASN